MRFLDKFKERARQRATEDAFHALNEGSISLFVSSMERGAILESWSPKGLMLPHQIAQVGSPAFFDVLTKFYPGWNLDLPLPDKRTPLWIAVVSENMANIGWLVNAGAQVNIVGPGNMGLLNVAAKQGKLVILKLLASGGGDWSAVDQSGSSPMEILKRLHPNKARLLGVEGGTL